MNTMSGRHPGTVCIHMLCILLPVMFGINPVTAGTGLISGMIFFSLIRGRPAIRELLIYPAIVLASGGINPLFNHNGRTVLFFMNRNPVTMESVLYGLVMGMLIATALVWGRCFSLVMDTDRLLTVLGKLHPKAALTLSMALRFIPLMRTQAGKIREAQRGLGLIREDNGLDRVRSALRVLDGMTGWSLENGILMADSMTARGFGSGRRTRYRLYPWEKRDTVMTAFSLVILGAVLAAHFTGFIGYTWYPELAVPEMNPAGIGAYVLYGILCLCSVTLEIKDRIRWKYLRSKI